MKLKLVCIEWVDAEAADSGWTEDDPGEDPQVLKTYGLLVRKDNNFVVHASTYDPALELWSERAKIPSGMVKRITTLATVEV